MLPIFNTKLECLFITHIKKEPADNLTRNSDNITKDLLFIMHKQTKYI